MNNHADGVAMASQSFINRVIQYLEHHVMQARAILGIADIHTRAFTNGFESFEDTNTIGTIISRLGTFWRLREVFFFGHGSKCT